MSGKRIVEAALTALLLCLMAYQVTGEALHEWLGVAMTALVFGENLLMLLFWAFAGTQLSLLLRRAGNK